MPQQQDFKNLIDLLETGLIVVNAKRQVLLWNPFIARTTGISEAEALGKPLDKVFDAPIDPALTEALEDAITMSLSRRLAHQLHAKLLPLFQKNSDQPLNHSILIQPVIYQQQAACLLQISNVTNTVRREQHLRTAMEQVRHLAHYDSLTGLANRALLATHLNNACDFAAKNQQPFALLFIDLDGFKSINDRFGHDAGDFLLKTLAERIQTSLALITNGLGVAARLGGDEMVALAPNMANSDLALDFANSLCQTLAKPVGWRGLTLKVGASIGVAMWPNQGLTAKALMTSADNAMYLAKARGKGQAMCALNTQ